MFQDSIGILAAEISRAKPAVAIESVMFNFVSSPVTGRNMFAPQRDLPCFIEKCFGSICGTRAKTARPCDHSVAASSAKSETIRSGWCGVSPKGRLRRSMKAVRMP